MILKQYFTDGLVQIAIILSLLRTDLNSYIRNNFVNYPEVQDIILGQSAAITQTNFHNFNNYVNNLHGHPKAIDNDISLILQDLRSLNRLSSWHTSVNRRNRVPAFLVGLSSSQSAGAIVSQDSSVPDNNNNNNNVQEETSTSGGQTTTREEENDNRNTEEVVLGADSPHLVPNSDLTSEDLDLIDVLWRQDIDLGVGKEVFDLNLRRELERERELELQKDRQKQKEKELLQLKVEEQRRRQEQQWLTENYMRDGETGEWVPLNGRNRNQPPQTITSPQNISTVPNIPQVPTVGLHQAQNVSVQQMQNINNMQNGTGHNLNQTGQFQNFLQYQTGMPMMNNSNMQHHISDASLRRELENDYHMTSPDLSSSYHHHHHHHQTSPVQQMPQEQNHMQSYNYTQQPVQQNSNPYQRQESLEQTWQDLVNLLELPSNESSMAALSNMTNNNNMTSGRMMPPMPSSMMSPQQNHSNALIQNATMPTPIDNTSANTSFDQAVPMTASNLSSTTPSEGCTSPLDWDPANMLFPNNSSPMEQNSSLEEVDDILTDIIDEGLDDLNITEMALDDGLRSMQMLDDASSESGVSMGSSGSPSQHDQFSDSAMSPFDGLEGATGGKDYGDSPSYNKGSDKYKFNNGGYRFNNENSEHSQSNYSSSSNDTDFNHRPASTHHIQHNHSYPLQPGQEPREYKKYMAIDSKPKPKGPHCRDKKKIQEMKIPLSMDQIVESQVEEFNEILTRHKLTEPQLQLIRDIRRRGKNKVAAQNCRKRKMDVIVNLEDDMSSLKDQKDKLLAERQMIDKQTRDMKDKFSSLYREIFQSLRDEHGRPYDPHHFSLQQSSDGNVFLVPRNVTADEQQAKATSKKRKNENGKKEL